ncbi:MAG: 50S ribosomal protein L28 [Candidatus Anoxychlamydiales bacterium]|nr:50S ribosomal protein L28 [Candidatus Anoxychlamydiales bacterium]NGX41591.1 50S ribosomal protein L28 [Candidatus Anoxychlamydiales bacterium]HEU64905.1 50S ribosomal protein L28 [Chlamydiota bacterium]
MSRRCQVTDKKPLKGRTYVTRGIAKKKKGIGLNITGKSKRRFLPNLFKKRFWFSEENRFITLKLTPAAMKTIDKLGLAKVIKKMRKQGKKI